MAQFTFDAYAPNHPTILDGSKYAIVTGVAYNNEDIILIGQTELTASISKTTFPADGLIDSLPSQVDQGDSFLMKSTITITHPSPTLIIKVKILEGFDDKFHFGKMSVIFGSSFVCLEQETWKYEYEKNYDRTAIVKIKLTIPMLFNKELTRDTALDANKIQISVPVTVLQGIDVQGTYSLAMGAMVDVTDVWSSTSTIEVSSNVKSTDSTSSPSSVTSELVSDVVYPGSSALFKLTVDISSSDTGDLTTIISCSDADVTASSVLIVDTGLCGGVLLDDVSSTLDGDELTVVFANCKNLDTATTQVILNIAFSTSATVAKGSTIAVTASVGGISATGTLEFTTFAGDYEFGKMTVVGKSLGFENENLYPDTEIGMSATITVPANVQKSSIMLETTSSIKDNALDIKICKLEITSVGYGLPCIKELSHVPHLNKSDETSEFKDLGFIALDNTCPASIPDQNKNSFQVDLVYSLPIQPSFADGIEVSPALGIWNQPSTLFAAITAKSTSSSPLTQFEYSTKENADGSNIDPYLGSLHTDQPLWEDVVWHTRYVAKLPPRTRGPLTFTALSDTSQGSVKICRLVVKRIGRNMPCAQKPEGYLGDFNPSRIDYGYQTSPNTANLYMGIVSNWGTSMVQDLYADDDAIEIHSFYKHISGSVAPSFKMTFNGEKTVKDISTVSTGSAKPENLLSLNPAFESVLAGDVLGTAFKGVPKVVGLKLTVPSGFKGNVVAEFKNPDFSSKKFDFCDIKLTKAGLNCPCVERISSYDASNIVDGFPEAATINLELVHYPYSNEPTENEVYVELTLRFPADYPGTDASIDVSIAKTSESSSLTLDVSDPDASFGDQPNAEFAIGTHDSQLMYTANTADKIWIAFNISIPRNSMIPLSLVVVTPSLDGRAVMTIEDARFKETGTNICCINENVDLEHMFNSTIGQTSNVTTFMQQDILEIDMGYVLNGHFSERREYELKSDSIFVLEVLVQMTDHPLTDQNVAHKVSIAAKSNDTIAVFDQIVTSQRSSMDRGNKELPLIEMKMEVQDLSREYVASDRISINATVSHAPLSRAEGSDSKVRLIIPQWLGYDSTLDTCTTNYSSSCNIEQPNGDKESALIFVFSNGIHYTDIISINFTLTVDPLGRLPSGKGLLDTPIISQALCSSSSFYGIPVDDSTISVCGPFIHTSVKVLSPDCDAQVTIDNECAVQASSSLDDQHKASNVLNNSSSTVWSPAIRSGSVWQHFIDFDFQEIASITSVLIQSPDNGYNKPTKVSIFKSFSPSSFEMIESQMTVPVDGILQLTSQVTARYMRLRVDESTGSENQFGISNIEWKGCPKKSVTPLTCDLRQTPLSTNPAEYRHFAEDSDNQILYFCDVNPYRVGIFCYSVKQGTMVFVELPRYITYIQGFSPTTGRMYFKVS